MQLNQDFNSFMGGLGMFVNQVIDKKSDSKNSLEDTKKSIEKSDLSPLKSKNVRIDEPIVDELVHDSDDSDDYMNDYLDDDEELSGLDPNETEYNPNSNSVQVSNVNVPKDKHKNFDLNLNESLKKSSKLVQSTVIEDNDDSQEFSTAKNTGRTNPPDSNRKSDSDQFYTPASDFDKRL